MSSTVANQGENYAELRLVMRSRTTGGQDSEVIRVWDGEAAEDVAKRVADGYGANVESIQRMDGTEYKAGSVS